MSFTIKVDDEFCRGAQRCILLAPQVFGLTEHGIAEVTDASTLAEEEAENLAHECPNMAIIVEKTPRKVAD